ncbi:MAG: S-layer homology domain-containing protein, partial [Defluviitaleaceae bacterium]|nr:S-layer homology domain-containing protein [Defluviitaleaceae bacterium]
IRYRIAGSSAWHVHATGVDASLPFNFSLPQPGTLHYTDIGLFFGDVPAGFAVGNEIVYTFIVGADAPNNVLINRFFITYNDREVEGDSPDRPVVIPPGTPGTPGTPEPPTTPSPALPPGTPLPQTPAPYIPWDPSAPGQPGDDEAPRLAEIYELDPVNPIPISPLHHAYMIGFYEDGTIRPTGNMTRAEAITIFFRLMDDSHRASIWSQENNFNDVQEHHWFNNAISTMANAGIITGNGGYFRPNDPITRAEFAVFAARFMGHGNSTVSGGRFSDIGGHWAEQQINAANELGWVTGFGDGTFRPNQFITRAEVAALTNRVLQRLPETVSDLLPGMIMWPDNQVETTWYFIYIQEATNSNYFEMKADGIHKTWTGLFTPRNWRALERPYSTPWSR